MRYSLCEIYIYICVLSIGSGFNLRLCLFSLSPSLHSLCPVSRSFSSITRPTLSRKVPPCKPGPSQGFFLLNDSFSLPLLLCGGLGSGFLTL